ncbi:MFS transporter [Horticoccus sp. 23ND18S-11]|uniref:MFS transporter n=1 Tax=Horticoccus sp. 23ND18S-11 TaxID=3391832 RepID=UPI0039C8F223
MQKTVEASARAPAAKVTPTPPARGAVAALSLSVLLASLGTSIANVGLPTFAEVFGATFQEVQWIVLSYLLAVTALIVSVGRLGDLLGRRRLLLAGILLFTLASLLCGFAPTLGLLITARALQGLGAAAMMALTLAFVGDIVPQARTGRAMGLLGTMSAIGTALGPSLGGLLIHASSWRTLFLINAPLGLAALLLAWRHLPADRRHVTAVRIRFDGVGTLLLTLALAAYALAMTVGRGHFGAFNLALLFVAAVAAGLFVFAESKVAAPLVRLTLLRDRGLRTGLLTSGVVASVMMTTLVVGPFYLALALGLTSAAVGLVLSIGPLVAALMGVPAGRMADRLGTHRVTLIGLLGIAGGALVLAVLPAPAGIAGYVVPIAIITVSYALFQTANNTAVMRDIAADQRGVVSGLLNLSRNLGLVTGASAMGAVFAFGSATTDITTAGPAAVADGMRITFAVAATLTGLALTLAQSVRPPTAPKDRLARQSAPVVDAAAVR